MKYRILQQSTPLFLEDLNTFFSLFAHIFFGGARDNSPFQATRLDDRSASTNPDALRVLDRSALPADPP